MTLPEPRGPGPSERRGPRRPPSRPSRGRPSACRRRRLFLPSRLSPRVCERARGGPVFSRRSRSPPPPPLVRGRPPSRLSRRARWRGVSSPARPVPGLPTPPGAGPGSSRSPRRCASLPRVWGGPPRPRTRSRAARPRPPAWNRGVVSRRGASRGSASVSRRLGGSRRVASPGSGHPPPSSRSSLPLVRPRPAVRCPLPAAVCRGVSGDSRRSLGRPPSAVLVSLPARVFRVAPLARSRASRPRSLLARAPTWLILPVAYACLKD